MAYRTRRPRRTRFVVETSFGEQFILCYTAEQARTYYENVRGYAVYGVKPWAAKWTPPADSGWRLNEANLVKAIEFLGLTRRVEIKQTGHKGGRRGAYYLKTGASERSADMYHRITAKSWLPPAQASRTLWHELTHAMQAERILASNPRATSDEVWKIWRSEYWDGTGYEHKPHEIEANAYADDFAAELPLAV